jgi:DNA-binding NarL/FixJ family response regulator
VARTVLVVDDDPSFRVLAARILGGWGHEVVGEAATSADALDRAVELRPDVVLVDIGLPDGNGFALSERLRAMPGPPRVVLISSDADRANAAAALRAGACGFIPKRDLPGTAAQRLIEER